MLLVTSEELTAHIGYYLIGLGMNFEDEESNGGELALHTYVVDQIERAMSSSFQAILPLILKKKKRLDLWELVST